MRENIEEKNAFTVLFVVIEMHGFQKVATVLEEKSTKSHKEGPVDFLIVSFVGFIELVTFNYQECERNQVKEGEG